MAIEEENTNPTIVPPQEVETPTVSKEDYDPKQAMIDASAGKVPDSAKASTAIIDVKDDELVAEPDALSTDLSLTADEVSTPTDVGKPDEVTATTVDPTLVTEEELGTMEAAKGELSEGATIADEDIPQGTVSDEAVADAITGTVSDEATVRFQMAELTSAIQAGEPLPPWAAPAARKVSAIMNARGLGSSSMAGAAMMQAIMESAIPIAQQDAATYAEMDITNLNNRQAAALQNAATYAAMDRANLDARLQAAVTNAQSFLAIDLANLTNDQKTREVNYQAKIQAVFDNQAAENAAAQFNAKSQNDIDMFMTELGTQVATANANRAAAAEQFNVNQKNAMAQFEADLNSSREQFNTTMKFQVAESNANWRRQANTANTAAINATIQQNTMNAFNMSVTAMNNVWQEYRDELAWANTSAENEKSRAHEITLYALQQANTMEMLDEELENSLWERAGEKLIDKIL